MIGSGNDSGCDALLAVLCFEAKVKALPPTVIHQVHKVLTRKTRKTRDGSVRKDGS